MFILLEGVLLMTGGESSHQDTKYPYMNSDHYSREMPARYAQCSRGALMLQKYTITFANVDFKLELLFLRAT